MPTAIADEFHGTNLKDKRLNDRSQLLLDQLYADSQASVNAACPSWAKTKAAYRFFNNPRVEHDRILEPHR